MEALVSVTAEGAAWEQVAIALRATLKTPVPSSDCLPVGCLGPDLALTQR